MTTPEPIHIGPDGTRYQLIATKTTTPTSDTSPKPVTVRFKTFWKTTRKWSDAEIAGYQDAVPRLAKQIRQEQYWDRQGSVKENRFTCEDFAIRVLVQFASSRGLPLKLETGVRTYRNVEVHGQPEHERYDSTMYGFVDMVELTYGAPDMQRITTNTVSLSGPEALLPGDILALAHDWKGRHSGGAAHHIQLATMTSSSSIEIYQGNSDSTIHRPITWFNKLRGRNAADPQQAAYAGLPIETGRFTRDGAKWNYRNDVTGNSESDYLKFFDLYRWNFMEFNR
ncbi:hypothetical protein [Burkholderia guangdongensis]|uniref:hypothetical protein n=1 Tax=Burkholderia guangdongensis TaxID=1792500 RepID=UPI001FE4A9B5|nr:hypothetical protein [Burkholderia guangdongensis]